MFSRYTRHQCRRVSESVRSMRPALYLKGMVRMFLLTWTVIFFSVVVISLSVVPLRIKGIRLCHWPVTAGARTLLLIFGIRTKCLEAYRIYQHNGMVFPNHMSYLDIPVMLAVMPVRFVSTHKVRHVPLLGWIAMAVDTLFVNRLDKKSRDHVRQQLAAKLALKRFPPLVLFPEGGIRPRRAVGPFRFGAFEIAVNGHAPYLTCAITYDRPEHVEWYEGNIIKAIWRLAIRRGPIHAQVIPVDATFPTDRDDPRYLASLARSTVAAVLESLSPAMVIAQSALPNDSALPFTGTG